MKYLVLVAVAAISFLALPQAEAGHCGFSNQGFRGQSFSNRGNGNRASVTVVRTNRFGGTVVKTRNR